jgi:hypothetical protein
MPPFMRVRAMSGRLELDRAPDRSRCERGCADERSPFLRADFGAWRKCTDGTPLRVAAVRYAPGAYRPPSSAG